MKAEQSGAVAVMALEKVPADIRAQGGVARMSDPKIIKEIKAAVSIPVMAKCRIGHFVEGMISLLTFDTSAQILEALNVGKENIFLVTLTDYIDESEVLTPGSL